MDTVKQLDFSAVAADIFTATLAVAGILPEPGHRVRMDEVDSPNPSFISFKVAMPLGQGVIHGRIDVATDLSIGKVFFFGQKGTRVSRAFADVTWAGMQVQNQLVH